ncbi:uncharacterized protein LOC118435455 isoform X1 [Folsomia candida]|uniref:uncharacterized protein LOC118435455 isoform X1 n=1 Tax=Folsomia candida TaxID=158441 RepID=UPI001604CA24|nr:uncharacterized protein LOC118435455 isoform X1 [Folsomia candida]
MSNFLRRVTQLFVWIGVTLGSFFFPIFLLGTYFWFKLAVFWRGRCGRYRGAVTELGTFLAPDKLFKNPNATLIHLAVLESTPDISIVSNHLQLIYDIPSDGKYSRKYAKLGFALEPWWGYLFWAEVDNFRMENQVHFIYHNKMDYENVSQFVEEIIRRPFIKSEPLWEIFVVTACSENASKEERLSTECFLIFRTHHLLLDGMSLIKLWNSADLVGESDTGESSAFEKIPPPPVMFPYGTSNSLESGGNNLKSFLAKLKVIVLTPFLGNKYLLTPEDRNILTNNYKKFSGPWYCSGVNRIHVTPYRQPLRDLGFSLTHALLVGYGRGIKKFISENYDTSCVPKNVSIMGSVPRPNYPVDEALTNHWSIMQYKADLTPQTLLGQLEYSKKEYHRAVHDIIPEAFEKNHKNYGMHTAPYKLYDILWDTKNKGTLSLSNIPGPPKKQKMFGVGVTDRAVWLPLTRHNSGIGLLLLTYDGWATISITADSGCIKSRALFNHLNKSIIEEMKFVLDEVLRMSQQRKSITENSDDNHNLLNIKDSPNISELHEVKVV